MDASAKLLNYGVDYENGVKRCMGNVDFYRRMLLLFMQDESFLRAQEAYEGRDQKALFEYLHELKGVCGNLAMPALYKPVSQLVEMVRGGNGAQEEMAQLFVETERAYRRAVEGISMFLGA